MGPPSGSDGAVSVYRVTVRGQFRELTDQARSWLASSAAEHDIFLSGFSEEGTFTYDARLAFFNLRYEVRVRADPSAAASDPAAIALREAEQFLGTLRIGHGPLRAAVMDMSAMTDRADRAQRRR